MQKYEAVIIGAGPAGLTAAIYLGRARVKTALFEKAIAGGQMAISELVENYPGFSDGISGMELSEKMRAHAEKFGAKIIDDEAALIKKATGGGFSLETAGGGEYESIAVIIAAGAVPRRLGIPGEDKFAGRGVSYCATCDGPLFKDKGVCVVGGGDTAVQEAVYLTRFCKKVYLIHRRDRLRAAKILQERAQRAKEAGGLEFVWESAAQEVRGDTAVRSVLVKDIKTGRMGELACDGVFIFAGIVPASGPIKKLVKTDNAGFIITDENMKTSQEGVFACGDVRKKPLWQIVTACGDGAVAGVSAQHYIEQQKGEAYV